MARRQHRIVIVDDDPLVVDVIAQALEGKGHWVDATTDWDLLSQIFLQEGCSLVLMDVNLQTTTGDSMARTLLRAASWKGGKRPPILYFSAIDESTMARLVQETGADGYLSKSLRLSLLVEAIEKFLPA